MDDANEDATVEGLGREGAESAVEAVSAAAELREARRDAIIEAVAAGASYPEVARQQNVSTKTVQRVLSDKDTVRRVAERRREMASETSGRLVQASAQAVTALLDALGEERTNDRIRAAHLILTQTTRFRTMEELEARVIELEARLDALEPTS